MAVPPLSTGALVVFGLVAVTLVLFVTEAFPPDVTAIGVLVALVVLRPYTGVPWQDALAGFASSATLTVVAMYVLSEGVQQTGLVERLGVHLARLTRGEESRLLAATVGATATAAGFVNNTPVVAVFVPMVTRLADRSSVSPSKLLLPLSYAAMLGGTLTLVGTATNVLASDLAGSLAAEYPGMGLHRVSMFEFTPVGVLVGLVGGAYLLTVGRWLTPARVPPESDLTDAYDLEDHLSRLVVRESSPLVGRPPSEAFDAGAAGGDAGDPPTDLGVLLVERAGEPLPVPESEVALAPDDVLVVRGSLQAVNRAVDALDLRQRPRESVTESDLQEAERRTLVEAVVLPDSRFVGHTAADRGLAARHDATLLAVRRDGRPLRTDLDDLPFEAGDALLLQAPRTTVEYFADLGDLVVTTTAAEPASDPGTETLPALSPKTPLAVGILAAVVGAAALDYLPIVIAALGGVFAMVATGCLTASDAYDAVSWNVVFLLAGVLPLGVALQRTGGAEFVAGLLAGVAQVLPVLAVLSLFYLVTGLLASVITPVASVVLMVPVAVDTASRVDASGMAFVFAVMFAASGAFATPVGYQTNLMVYGPGGYRFTDYVRVGAPLQLLLAVVVPVGVALVFGVH
ncbi:MAG: SLC13 family permease [Halobacteriaceae archaeon]